MAQMIKAIIFDCFGVLVAEAWEPFCDKYFGTGTQLRQEARDIGKQLNLGLISYDEFLKRTAALANISFQETQDYINSNQPNQPLFELLNNMLVGHYKLGMLSNAGSNRLMDLFLPEQLKVFDSIVLSYEYKYVKPQPEIYEIACEKLGVQPKECIFVDDIERYCAAAELLGMKAIWYQNFGQMKQELEALLAGSDH